MSYVSEHCLLNQFDWEKSIYLMNQPSAQLQIEALKRSIATEYSNYQQAIQEGETNNTLKDISCKIEKLILILDFLQACQSGKQELFYLEKWDAGLTINQESPVLQEF